jgi:outer membrane immunogenic protein
MKRIFLASVAVLALAATAGAADLPRRYDPAPARSPYFAPAYNWSGFYVGINGGFGWGTSGWDSTNEFDVSGGLVGGTIGANWQNGAIVFGLEGDIDWSNIKGSTTAFCGLGCETSNNWLGTARGRIGYAFDRFMPYITGGLAVGDIRATTPGLPGAKETGVGWTAGGGFEFGIAGNWTAKAEYLYVDLGSFNCGFNCGPFNPDNVSFHTHVVRGGINFRF